MNTLTIYDLNNIDFDIRGIEIFPENWSKRSYFDMYKNTPRPCCAIFIVCSDIKVRFTQSNGDCVTAKKGSILFIPSSICYKVEVDRSDKTNIDTYTVNFSVFAYDTKTVFSEKICILAENYSDLFKLRFDELLQALNTAEGSRDRIKSKSAFYSILDILTSDKQDTVDVYYPIRAGVTAIKNEWNKNEKIDRYAKLSGISSTYFYQCFQKWSGMSPVKYRNLMRLSNAESMLKNTDMRISEISKVIGFDDPFYFCRIFTKHFGIPPKLYREKNRL